MTSPVATVANAITGGPEPAQLRVGVVTALEAGQGSRARLDVSGAAWLGLDTDANVKVGDRVWAVQQGPVWVVGGRLNGQRETTVPVGALTQWAGTAGSVPAGWLLCDGRSLLRADWPALFAAIGTTYGSTTTTFLLPDLEDRVPLGAGVKAVGSRGGSETVTLTEAQLPVHDHTFTGVSHNHTQDPHSHSLATGAANIGSANVAEQQVADNVSGSTGSTTASNNSATAGGTVGNAGSGQSHSNLQPYLAILFIIRAA